jgi:YD repeat-containing protein
MITKSDGSGTTFTFSDTTPYAKPVTTTMLYDPFQDMIGLTIGSSLSNARVSTMAYDAAGNLISQTIPGPNNSTTPVTTTYTYDALDRLISTIQPMTLTTNSVTTNMYDALNNITGLWRKKALKMENLSCFLSASAR